jgi:Flp pilus assembly protein TadG
MKTAKITGKKTIRYRGAATVEAAIMMTLLLLFTLGTIAFGYLFLRCQEIVNAARVGARVAVRDGATPGEVQDEVALFLTPVAMEYDGPTIPTGINPGVGNPVTVTVTGKGLNPLNIGNFLTNGRNVIPQTYTCSITMAKEGPSDCP